jgi:hypothetical protein
MNKEDKVRAYQGLFTPKKMLRRSNKKAAKNSSYI